MLPAFTGANPFVLSPVDNRQDRPRATGVRVERSSGAVHDLLRDHDLLDAFEAWQVEHSFKEYSLHDGAQPARPGLAVDRLPGDSAECFLRHSEIDTA